MLSKLARFFGPVVGSVAGHVNHRELARSLVASGAGSALVALAVLALQAVSANAAAIFPNPSTAALATTLIGLVLDLRRRMDHASGPAAAPVAPSMIYRGTGVE